MTISSTTTKLSYTGNGSTTTFPVTFSFFGSGATSELIVIERVIATGAETTKTYSTHYTISGGNGSTGTVIAGSAPADTVQWHIRRNTTQTQGTDYVENDAFPASSHEEALDRLTMINQEQETDLNQAFKYPDTYTGGASTTMPEPVGGAHVVFNADGTALTTSTDTAAQWLGGDGTAALPYYTYSSDPNSGFYRIGADNVGLSLGGVKKVDFGAATTAFTGEITATGFTGTLDGSLGSGAPAAAVVTQLTSGGNVVSDTDSTDDLGTTSVRWRKLWVDDIQTTADIAVAGDMVVTGNFTVNGTTITNDATNTEIKDPLIELNSGAGSNANDLGFIMERGSTGNNGFMGWDESADAFAFGTTTATGSSTGNISYADAQLLAEGATFSGTSPNLGTVTTVDINGGTIDGANVGASAQGTGQFTNLTGTVVTASTSLALASGATVTGINDTDAFSDASATTIATSESIKAYVDASAPEAGVKFAFETNTTDTDQGAGKVWLNHATPSSATVFYIDDVEAGGVSVNAWVDTWDDVTNAVARGYIYLAKYGSSNAIVVYKITGAVTSASTYSKVAVTHVVTVGSFSDGDSVGLTFMPSGADGAGDLASANNLSDVGSAATSFGNIKQNATTSATGVASFNSDNFAVSSGAVTIKDGGVVTAEIADNAVTLAKMASGTDGNIISFDSSGNPVAIPTGNDGQVLTSAGAGAQPAFEDAGGGDMVLLSTTNASTASTVDLTGNFTSTYSNYMVRGVDIFTSNSTETLMMQVIFDSTAITGSVYYGHLVRSNNSSNNYSGQAMNGTTAFNIINQLSSGSTQGTGFVLNVLNAPATNNSYKFFTWNGASAEGWSINYGAGGVNDASSSNMTGMRFLMSAGTVSGKFLLYGIK